ncbi:MAG: hypothetical protein H6817_00220 [Phycisphaerales bacterium]|nr:hypothetical protein [Phycisphaerales bacterium]
MRWFVRLLLLGLFAAPAIGQVAINEIRIDQTGTDDDEYFELYKSGGGSLSGYTYLVIGDGADVDSSGVIEFVLNLGLQSIPADGFFLVTESTFTLNGATPDLVTNLNFENSDNVTHMLVTGFTGANGQDLDTNDDGVFDVTPWTSVVDKIALIEEANPPTATEYHYGPPTVGPDGAFVPGHAYRDVDGTGTWQIGQFEIAGGADTPGSSNSVFPPPDAVGKVTAARMGAATGTITLCVTGQNTPITTVITALPSHGTLSDGGGAIGSVPHDVAGNLIYTPTGGYSGVDTFDFNARDNIGQVAAADATQEVAVQSGSVLISEVMHAPAGIDDIYEFVEIYNYGGSSVNLGRLDARRASDGAEKDTTDNLLGSSIPANSMRILAPEDATNPGGATDFRCEWQLAESNIIRVPLSQWEALFQAAPIGSDCFAAQASRVLLFNASGALLDLVDLGIQQADCISSEAGSYALDPGFPLNIQNASATFTQSNDNPIRWACAESFSGGEKRIGTVGGDSSTITSVVFHKPAFNAAVPCVYGACCLVDGECVNDVLEEECTDLNCGIGGLWHSEESCDAQSCSVVQPPAKCCLPGPAGLCANLSDCECLRVGGNADSGTCESNPGCVPSDGVTFNELDYDQVSTDTREFIELLGTANYDLSGWTLEFHNGNASTNGPTLIASRTLVLDAEPGGGTIPNDGGGLGYLVIGDFGVTNLDIDLCEPAGAECSNRIENGGVGANGNGDGLVLLHNGVVVEAISYDTGTTGFVARGGGADGYLLPDIGLVDDQFGALQRLPDGQTWTLTPNSTPGETNALGGACCSGSENATCDLVAGADVCTNSFGGEYLGDLTACEPFNPCIPRGACCLPSGACLANATSNACELQGGMWNGEGTECADVGGFVACVSGPGVAYAPGCESFDLADADTDVDLRDYWVFQRTGAGGEFCPAAPTGACCRVDGMCVEINQFDCEAFAGIYQGDGVSCDPDPGCVALAGDVLINELLSNNDGTDSNEFIELFGMANASLDGLSLIVVDGDDGGDTGAANYRQVNLWLNLNGLSLNPNGYLLIGTGPNVPADVSMESIAVIGSNSNGVPDELQNGTQTYAIVPTADVVLDGAKLTDGAIAAINASAIDTVATTDGSLGDHTYFNAPVVTDQDGFVLGYGQRLPNGTDTNTAADWEVLSPIEFGEVNSPTVPTWDSANMAIMGACCDGATCTQESRASCGANSFSYNTPCTPNPCVGSCCTPGLACSETTPEGCVAPNAFLGGGTNCTDNACVACGTVAQAEMEVDGTSVCITDAILSSEYSTINSGSVRNFYFQDTVGTNGLLAFGGTSELDALLVGATRGDLIEMRGEMATFFNRELISGATSLSLTVIGTGTLTPLDKHIADLPSPAGVPDEELDHVLVRMLNVEFDAIDQGDALLATTNYTIHDASNPGETMILRVQNGTASAPPVVGTTIPTGPVNIVGIANVFSGEFQIAPFLPEHFETP